MLRPVKLDYPQSVNDGRSDFLAIDLPSSDSYPSHVHSSHNGSVVLGVLNIRNTTTAIISQTTTNVVITVKVILLAGLQAPQGTWFYARVNNPLPSARFTSAKRNVDASPLDSDNTWSSHRIIHSDSDIN